jgi:hypothetical protein
VNDAGGAVNDLRPPVSYIRLSVIYPGPVIDHLRVPSNMAPVPVTINMLSVTDTFSSVTDTIPSVTDNFSSVRRIPAPNF